MHRLLIAILLTVVFAACSSRDELAAPRDVGAPPADALKTPSGLASKVLRVGLGATHPRPESMVTVHYTGWTADGKMFETTQTSRQPATLRVTDAIPGWVEGLQLMRAGEKRRFWIPGSLAYDRSPNPELPKGMLVFDIELVRIQ
jgi:peptidylprolyl isomerase